MLHVAVPVFDERDWLPRTLDALAAQEDVSFRLWLCVNQAERYHVDPDLAPVAERNRQTLAYLTEYVEASLYPITYFDKTGPGQAPADALAGVGWARRFLFSQIEAHSCDDDIWVSLDADTDLDPNYLASVVRAFRDYPKAVALTAPYYHRLPEDPCQAVNLLRYELYMRHYRIGLARAGSPYAFTALGSAMAFRPRAYRAVRGFPPRQAGEDFYLLQNLRKHGALIQHLDARVYPASRPSDRVPFGTGPVVGAQDPEINRERYPFYHPRYFQELADGLAAFKALHRGPVQTTFEAFFKARGVKAGLFEKMRRNHPRQDRFIHACHEYFDGLRTLQYLRHQSQVNPMEGAFEAWLDELGYPETAFHVETASIEQLSNARDFFVAKEQEITRARPLL